MKFLKELFHKKFTVKSVTGHQTTPITNIFYLNTYDEDDQIIDSKLCTMVIGNTAETNRMDANGRHEVYAIFYEVGPSSVNGPLQIGKPVNTFTFGYPNKDTFCPEFARDIFQARYNGLQRIEQLLTYKGNCHGTSH